MLKVLNKILDLKNYTGMTPDSVFELKETSTACRDGPSLLHSQSMLFVYTAPKDPTVAPSTSVMRRTPHGDRYLGKRMLSILSWKFNTESTDIKRYIEILNTSTT